MAVTRFGAYTSHLLADRAWVRRLPQEWSFEVPRPWRSDR